MIKKKSLLYNNQMKMGCECSRVEQIGVGRDLKKEDLKSQKSQSNQSSQRSPSIKKTLSQMVSTDQSKNEKNKQNVRQNSPEIGNLYKKSFYQANAIETLKNQKLVQSSKFSDKTDSKNKKQDLVDNQKESSIIKGQYSTKEKYNSDQNKYNIKPESKINNLDNNFNNFNNLKDEEIKHNNYNGYDHIYGDGSGSNNRGTDKQYEKKANSNDNCYGKSTGNSGSHKQQEKKTNEGLPNIGNTCFLNSSLQTLFAASFFRKYIIQMKDQRQNVASVLKKIFLSIQNQDNRDKKEALLQKFVKLLRNQHQSYLSYSQQDSYDFLNLIIQKVGEKNKNLLQMFTVEYLTQCLCKKQRQLRRYVESAIPIQSQVCTICNKKQIIRLKNKPSYLICIGNKKVIGNQTISFPFQQKKKGIQYILCSQIIYYGSGNSGHYISYRKDKQGDFSYFDDNIVTKVQDSTREGPATVFLYEKGKEINDYENSKEAKKNNYENYEKKGILSYQEQQSLELKKNKSKENSNLTKQNMDKAKNQPLNKVKYSKVLQKAESSRTYKSKIMVVRKLERKEIKRQPRQIIFRFEKITSIFSSDIFEIKILNDVNFFYAKEFIMVPNKDAQTLWNILTFLEKEIEQSALNHPLIKSGNPENIQKFFRQDFIKSKNVMTMEIEGQTIQFR